jgi:hypothetical protein
VPEQAGLGAGKVPDAGEDKPVSLVEIGNRSIARGEQLIIGEAIQVRAGGSVRVGTKAALPKLAESATPAASNPA